MNKKEIKIERKKFIKKTLDYIADRGFRESNYEMDELIKWLREQQNGK